MFDKNVAPQIRAGLIRWFQKGHRDMPWRRTKDPYSIWVSEIMLQQTRVDTVIPYFERWMARFPTATKLADAPLDEVLAHWSGLGYYARARNLHAAAREIATSYRGQFPQTRDEIRALPGIGRSTSGAIMSIAFEKPEPILDGNVARVLSRLFLIEGAPNQKAMQDRLWEISSVLVPNKLPGDFNQSMMELGATLCTPTQPRCGDCPVAKQCAAREAGVQDLYPAAKKKRVVPSLLVVTIAVVRDRKLLLLKRPVQGLWGGLWEPPTGEVQSSEDPRAAAARVLKAVTGLSAEGLKPLDRFEHVLTHKRMQFIAFSAEASGRLRRKGYDDARWLPIADREKTGLAAWTTRIFKKLSPTETSEQS